jgi:putative tricarboxylic transport membrane protein
MVDTLHGLMLGFESALTLQNLLYCIIGCMMGTAIGMIPGIGPPTTISLLLPLAYMMPADGAMIMLAGIYYGAQYGDNVSAITMKMPHASSIVMCIDGNSMHKNGRTGLALFTAGVSSFIGGTIAFALIVLLAPTLSRIAISISPADYVMIILAAFMCVGIFSSSLLMGIAMALLGVLLSTIGTDLNSGILRFTASNEFLIDGIHVVIVAIGCFGVAELVKNIQTVNHQFLAGDMRMRPAWLDLKRILVSATRGSFVGSLFGLIPGGGPILAQFASYSVEGKVSKFRHELGTGSIEGIAAPAAGDEAAARTSFVPLLSLGIPENIVMTLFLGLLISKGIQPGPQLIMNHPALFWGVIASMWIGNIFLLIVNVPLVKMWLTFFKIPFNILYPVILFLCCLGTFSLHNNWNDVYMVAAFGVIGYLLTRLGMPLTTFIMGLILGPILEENFRRQMLMSSGDLSIFWTSPISKWLLIFLCCIFALNTWKYVAKQVKNA